MRATVTAHEAMPGPEHLPHATTAQRLEEKILPQDELGAAALKELFELVGGHPALPDQLFAEGRGVRKGPAA